MKIADKRIIKALKSGKSIRRKEWPEGYVANYNSHCDWIEWHGGSKSGCMLPCMLFRLSEIKANDWEIV